MRYALALLAAGLMSVMSAQAQTATDLNEGQRVTTSATTGVFTLSWWGQAGRTYFIQQSFDLMTWQYVPVVMSGAAAVTGMNFSCSDSRQFWRLRYTDQVYSGTAEAADFDYDGVSNQAELNAGLDVFSADTDGDALPDGWELANNLDAKSTLGMNGAEGDPDGDELTNLEEYNYGTNPRAGDTDADTLSDYAEAYVYFTNPSLADSDSDGLSDAAEVLIYFTDPMNWDTDGDSLSDSAEVNTHLTNPLSKDSDNDGLNDDAEINTYQTNPNAADSDNDGISDKSEIKQGTDAKSASSRPAFESVEVVGDGAAGVRKTKQLTITLPQGERSYMVVIAAYSEEYPRFTGYQSEFDDVVDWKITPAGGTVIEGEKHVNELHGEWEQSATNGTTYLGLSPVAVVKIETIQGKASGTTSVQIELGAKNVSDALLPSTLAAALLPIDIEPDANMAGVVGDVVKSAKAGSTVKHFVTPKKSTELNQDYVELKAVGADTATFTQLLEWEGGEAGSTADKRKVMRDTAGKTEVKIKTKQGGTVAAQMNVWVVWSTTTTTDVPIAVQNPVNIGGGQAGLFINGGYSFENPIQPSSIITEQERPDLSGGNATLVPGGNHWTGAPLSGGADKKWDTSRQMRTNLINPAGIAGAQFTQPAPVGGVTYPQDRVEGNDDRSTGDENNDPYSNGSKLNGFDQPGLGISHAAGSNGDTVEWRLHFREFNRLEINKKWFRISDDFLWRMHFKMKKANGQWDNDQSVKELNNAGW